MKRTSTVVIAALVLSLAGCGGSGDKATTSPDSSAELTSSEPQPSTWQTDDARVAGGPVSDVDFAQYQDTIRGMCVDMPTSTIVTLLEAAQIQANRTGNKAVVQRMIVGLDYACPDRVADVQRQIQLAG